MHCNETLTSTTTTNYFISLAVAAVLRCSASGARDMHFSLRFALLTVEQNFERKGGGGARARRKNETEHSLLGIIAWNYLAS